MNIEKTLQEIRDERSIELFDKPESLLQIAEIKLLDEYINDLNNPSWLPVKYDGYPTMYAVSNTGEVKNIQTGLIIKQKINKDGYKMFNLCISGKKYTTTIHKLVGQAFIPNPENKPILNHKNGKKYLNWYKNLEWATYQENTQHAINNGLAGRPGESNPNNKVSEYIVHKICKLLEDGLEASSINKIIPDSYHIAAGIKRGKLWKNIASQYNIPKPVSVLRSQDLKDYMTELIFAGYSNREIVQAAGLPDTEHEREYVGLFRRRLFKKLNETT